MPIAYGLDLKVNGVSNPITYSTTSPVTFTCEPWSFGPGNDRAADTFAWTFGDASTSSAQNPAAHSFAPGVYTVGLTCTFSNAGPASISDSLILTITASSVADFSATPLSGTAPLAVAFTDLSTPTPSAWAWTFGDGATSTSQNPSHTYAAAGTYTVTLTATISGSPVLVTKVAYITVTAPAAAPTIGYGLPDYTAAMLNLLPRGPAWPRDLDATITKVVQSLAAAYVRSDARARVLLLDSFPATAVELLPEWEAAVGVPGPFGTLAGTIAGQQAQVVAALIAVGSQSKAYFIGLLASLGYTATITEYVRFTVLKPIGTPISGDGWAHSWLIDIAGVSAPLVEALVRLYAPAHTDLAFTYH